jgi:hypothetical protein
MLLGKSSKIFSKNLSEDYLRVILNGLLTSSIAYWRKIPRRDQVYRPFLRMKKCRKNLLSLKQYIENMRKLHILSIILKPQNIFKEIL